MTTKRPPITFYANQVVEEWLNTLPAGQRSQIINKALILYMEQESQDQTAPELQSIQLQLHNLQAKVEKLEQEAIVDSDFAVS